jgi:hypothetical protein
MPVVFEPAWIQDLEKKYGRQPRYRQPDLYRLATDPRWAQERENIERWVKLLPETSQEKFVHRLRDPDQFSAAYSELVVGALLRQCGHQPEYEKPLGDRTPDWYVHPTEDTPAFFVEVATVFPTSEVQARTREWDELRFRLEEIEHYFHIWIYAPPETSLKGADQKRIVRFVRDWLDTLDPETVNEPQEKIYENEDLRISFRAIPKKVTHKGPVATGGPGITFLIDVKRLQHILRKKLGAYRQARVEGTPLVVALVPTFESGFSEDDVLDALFGQEQVIISFQGDKIITVESGRSETGLITPKLQKGGTPIVHNRRLSAVLWVTTNAPPSMKVFHNPYALHPLPPQTFRGFPNLVAVHQDLNGWKLVWIDG